MGEPSIAKELLKDRESIFITIRHGNFKDVLALFIQFVLISVSGIFLYGFVMGTFHPSVEYWLLLGFKLLLVIIGSSILCLPTLYILTSLSGSDKSLPEVFILLFGKLAVVGLILFGFLPIVWFFTLSIENPSILRTVNIILIGIGFIFSIFFLGKGIRFFTEIKRKRNKLAVIMTLFVWLLILFGVIFQMAENVKPFFRLSEGFAKVILENNMTIQEINEIAKKYQLEKVCGVGDKACLGENGKGTYQKAEMVYRSEKIDEKFISLLSSDSRIVYCKDLGTKTGYVNGRSVECYFQDLTTENDLKNFAKQFQLTIIPEYVSFFEKREKQEPRKYFFIRIPKDKNEMDFMETLEKKDKILEVEFVKEEVIDKRELKINTTF